MNLTALHRKLLQDVLEIGNTFPLVITGGYAVQAHGLVDRLSRDIDVATDSPRPMSLLADHLIAALSEWIRYLPGSWSPTREPARTVRLTSSRRASIVRGGYAVWSGARAR
jgi:hypothetical protein